MKTIWNTISYYRRLY